MRPPQLGTSSSLEISLNIVAFDEIDRRIQDDLIARFNAVADLSTTRDAILADGDPHPDCAARLSAACFQSGSETGGTSHQCS
jgi:hypothetical protein